MTLSNPLLAHIDSDILRYIVEQGLQPGDRVPPLSELSNELNISVSKLREQLEAARVLGVVEVRPRTGIRCLDFDFMPVLRLGLFFSMAQDTAHFDLYSNLRIHIEVAYWHEATALLQPEDFEALRELIAGAQARLRGTRITIP
ncbi:MAG: FadR/GntR family transcriptional regulator, partial [Anaerolineales bacterium]